MRSPERSLPSMGMEIRQEAQLSFAQQQRSLEGKRADIATQIRRAAEDHMFELITDARTVYSQIITDDNFTGITGRVARGALFRYVNKELPLGAAPAEELEQAHDMIEECVSDAFDDWWRQRHDFVPSHKMAPEAQFIARHKPIDWSETHVPLIERAKARMNGVERKDELKPQVQETIRHIDQGLGINTAFRENFDRVRSAAYKAVTVDNIESVLDRIEEVYNEDLLKAETIALLKSADPAVRKAFIERTERGVFVSGFRERIKGKPSVRDQMEKDFTREYKENEPRYEGRYLEDENGKILAWLTYWQPPREVSKKNATLIRQYLKKGVTGARMTYANNSVRDVLHNVAAHTVMIDTIQGPVRPGARRLMAHVTQDMQERSPYLKKFLGYYLDELFFRPSFEIFGREEVHLSQNASSFGYFSKLGCKNFATDRNPNFGPWSSRTLPDGQEIKLDAQWAAFVGDFPTVVQNARNLWHQDCLRYGDISKDGLSESSHWRWMRYPR